MVGLEGVDGTVLASKAKELHDLVAASAKRHAAPSILLSGGLDTSVLAGVAAPFGLRSAYTVLVGAGAPDEDPSRAVAAELGLHHHVIRPDLEGLLQELPLVVRQLTTFDPMEVRNSLVVARGLRAAREAGEPRVMTGDGADELFGGYSFLWEKPPEEFARSSERMIEVMRFSSFPLGRALGIEVEAPFLDPAVVAFSRGLSKAEKVAAVDGTMHGKFLLRLAFPGIPNRWRRKDPIEVGSGSAGLPRYFQERTTEADLRAGRDRAQAEGVHLRDPEHLAYYRAFRRVFGDDPPVPRTGRDPCQGCGFDLPTPRSDFCVTCGAWPARSGRS